MSCDNQINTQDLISAKTDAVTLGEVATSRAGAESGGAPITQATNRFGEVTDTVQGRLSKLGVLYDDPIKDWSAGLLVSDLRAHRYPATTGDIYIPVKPLPFTTGVTFNSGDWVLLNGYADSQIQASLITDLSQSYEFKNVSSMKDSLVALPVGKKVSWSGYYAESDGGGNFGIVKSGTHTEDGGSIFTLSNGNYVEANIKGGDVSVKQFGAKGDGVSDDAPAIRAAFSYAFDTYPVGGGVTIYFPTCNEFYSCLTADPSNPTAIINIDKLTGSQFVSNVQIKGQWWSSRVVVGISCDSVFQVPTRLTGLKMDDLWIDCGNLVNYGLLSNAEPNREYKLSRVTVQNPVEAGFYIDVFVASLDSCETLGGKYGFIFNSLTTGPVTSITLTACYADKATDIGYWFGFATYCTLNSCATDGDDISTGNGIDVGYQFDAGYGITMNACGAEKAHKYLKVLAHRGMVINAPYLFQCGSYIADIAKSDYMIEIESGSGVAISGMTITNNDPNIAYEYKLGVTGNAFGSENVTVLDRSILRGEYYAVSNFGFDRPVKLLRGDETTKTETLTISDAQTLFDTVLLSYINLQVNDTVTLQLTDGIYDISALPVTFSNLSGYGTIILQGNGVDNTAVTLQTDFYRIQGLNCTCKLVFKDISFSSLGSNNSFGRTSFTHCTDVVFDNCLFVKVGGVNAGSAIRSLDGSTVRLSNGSRATAGGWAGAVYSADATSQILLDKSTAPPTAGYWDAGVRFYYDDTNLTSLGAIVTTAGADGTQVWTDV